jgi:two-component system chemotaxis response regulator CheB
VTNGAKVNNIRPSVDVLMESVAEQYGTNVIGVLMTGMGQDGADGLKVIKDLGGRTIAQDQKSCTVFGMPKAAIDKGVVDKVVPLNKIAKEIISMLRVKQ